MKHDLGLGQDPPLANASEPIIPRGSPEVKPKPWDLSIS